MRYDRSKAIEYSHRWWNKRNPLFYDFEELGGDCTNFISQCLHTGEIDMDENWFYYNLNNRAPSWTGVNEFFAYVINHHIAKLVTIDNVEVGDLVQLHLFGFEYFHHTAIITKINGQKTLDNICVTCHTKDEIDIPLSNYNIKKIKFLKIII